VVTPATYVPDRGDVIWLDFTPNSGHEQGGRRPALIVSPAGYNRKTGLALVFPITSHVKGYPFETRLPAGLPVFGVVLSDHIKNLDWKSRRATFICRADVRVLNEALAKLHALTG
jgi:mRNA interferase MazF